MKLKLLDLATATVIAIPQHAWTATALVVWLPGVDVIVDIDDAAQVDTHIHNGLHAMPEHLRDEHYLNRQAEITKTVAALDRLYTDWLVIKALPDIGILQHYRASYEAEITARTAAIVASKGAWEASKTPPPIDTLVGGHLVQKHL